MTVWISRSYESYNRRRHAIVLTNDCVTQSRWISISKWSLCINVSLINILMQLRCNKLLKYNDHIPDFSTCDQWLQQTKSLWNKKDRTNWSWWVTIYDDLDKMQIKPHDFCYGDERSHNIDINNWLLLNSQINISYNDMGRARNIYIYIYDMMKVVAVNIYIYIYTIIWDTTMHYPKAYWMSHFK